MDFEPTAPRKTVTAAQAPLGEGAAGRLEPNALKGTQVEKRVQILQIMDRMEQSPMSCCIPKKQYDIPGPKGADDPQSSVFPNG